MLLMLLCLGAALPAAAPPWQPTRMLRTSYHVIRTDLDEQTAGDMQQRLECLGDEFVRRLGRRHAARPLVVWLFCSEADYRDAGGPEGTQGYFTGKALLAHVGDTPGPAMDHVLQHEAFHQFAPPGLPVWLNEGLAEYFGEAEFTGEGYRSGQAPNWRVARIKQTLQEDGFLPLEDLLAMTQSQWLQRLKLADYDQAWSLVQFLAHGRGEQGQEAMASFVHDVSRGRDPQRAWREHLGDVPGVESAWREYWRTFEP